MLAIEAPESRCGLTWPPLSTGRNNRPAFDAGGLQPGSQRLQLGIDLANNFMLMTLFSIIADMTEDPDAFRSDV